MSALATIRPSRRKRRPQRAAACGTPAGYQRHKRAGEPSCEPCRVSVNDSRMDVERVQIEKHLAHLMVARPDLSTTTTFGGTHYAGAVMGA